LETALSALLAYLIGGIPFAYLVVRATKGIDLRTTGSGNVGATNASRLYEGRERFVMFAVIFLLDASKGWIGTALLPRLLGDPRIGAPVGGAAAVLGHIFSPYLGFAGGKAVATTFGALLGLEPVATLLALAVFFVVYAATRVVGAGSVAFAVALPVLVAVRGRSPIETLILAIALGAIILVRHRSNIARMLGRAGS
jgi:glycerol-3-phosphate acyltransferase PlsY